MKRTYSSSEEDKLESKKNKRMQVEEEEKIWDSSFLDVIPLDIFLKIVEECYLGRLDFKDGASTPCLLHKVSPKIAMLTRNWAVIYSRTHELTEEQADAIGHLVADYLRLFFEGRICISSHSPAEVTAYALSRVRSPKTTPIILCDYLATNPTTSQKHDILKILFDDILEENPLTCQLNLKANLKNWIQSPNAYKGLFPLFVLGGQEAWQAYSEFIDITLGEILDGNYPERNMHIARVTKKLAPDMWEQKKQQLADSVLFCTTVAGDSNALVLSDAVEQLFGEQMPVSRMDVLAEMLQAECVTSDEYLLGLIQTGLTLRYLEKTRMIMTTWSGLAPTTSAHFAKMNNGIEAYQNYRSQVPFSALMIENRQYRDFICSFILNMSHVGISRSLFRQLLRADDLLTFDMILLGFPDDTDDFECFSQEFLNKIEDSGQHLADILKPSLMSYLAGAFSMYVNLTVKFSQLLVVDLVEAFGSNPNAKRLAVLQAAVNINVGIFNTKSMV